MIRSRRADDSDYWYRQDIRGSVTNIVSVDDSLVKSYTYDAYGNTTDTGTFINSFAYTGTVIDTETGLYYMNARYYDPMTGRFISEDSYRGDGEAFWHLYAYCNGDPVNATDPTGHAKYGAVLYDGKYFSREAEDERNYLKKTYKLTDAYKFKITCANDFVRSWNLLSNLYTAVSLIFHGNGHAFSCSDASGDNIATSNSIKTGDIKNTEYRYTTSSLKYKSGIKYLRLGICNAGHLNHLNDNLAQAFYYKIAGNVWACDGSVSYYFLGMYGPRLSSDESGFFYWLPDNSPRTPKGFYWFSNRSFMQSIMNRY